MEKEKRGSAGFDKTGTLVCALDEKDEKRIKTGIALAKSAGYTGEYITDKDRIKKILPMIDPNSIIGAGYTADDGYFDGTMIPIILPARWKRMAQPSSSVLVLRISR